MSRLPLTYTRPAYVSKEDHRQSHYSDSEHDKKSLRSFECSTSKGIPDGLTFDKVMCGKTCPVSHA